MLILGIHMIFLCANFPVAKITLVLICTLFACLVLDWVLIEMVLGLGVQDPKIDKPHWGNPVCLQDAG